MRREVELYFDGFHARFEAEWNDGEFSICLTENEEDKEESTNNHVHLKPVSTTRVYLEANEIKSIINTLEYLLKENDKS